MRFFLILTCVLINSVILLGQKYQEHDGCGTIFTREADIYLRNTLAEREELVDQYYEQLRMGRTLAIEIPVQFHISRTDEGSSPSFSELDIQDALKRLNEEFSTIGVTFMNCVSTSYIDNTAYHTDFSKDNDDALRMFDRPNVLNIYIFRSITSSDGTGILNGYAKFPKSKADRIVVKSVAARVSTIIHEIGHYFSLRHTYGGSVEELVDGSNCHIAGDRICDTPPDPGERRYFDNCIYTGTVMDVNGDSYNPDGYNYMGKGQGACRNKFSIKQRRRMLASIFVDRNNLVQCSDYTFTTVCNTMITSNHYPSTESFEYLNEGAKWQVDLNSSKTSGFHWGWKGGSTSTSSTGPSRSSDGNYYMYVDASDFQDQIGIINSPCFDLRGKGSAQIEFDYHMYGNDIGKLELQASENGNAGVEDGDVWESLWSEEGDQGNNWLTAQVELDKFVDKIVRLRILGYTLDGSKGDIALDKIIVSATDPVVTNIDNGANGEDFVKMYFNSNSKTLILNGLEQVKEPFQLFVTNVSGKVVYNEWITSFNTHLREYRLDANQWNVGVYVIRIQSQGKKFSSTFIVR